MPRNNEIQFRRGTGQEWDNANPVLSSGEPGFDSTYKTIKIGDGNTDWQNLATSNSILAYKNINNNTSLNYSDHLLFLDSSLQDIAIQLPLASGFGGKCFVFKKKNGNFAVNIFPSGSETIDNKNNYQIYYNKNSISVVSDNSNWYII